MNWALTAISVLVIALMLSAAIIIPESNARRIFVTESSDFIHTPNDLPYLSVADGKVIIRVSASGSLNISELYVIIGNKRVPMKRQLSTGQREMWFAYLPYDGKGFEYYFEAKLGDGTTLEIFYERPDVKFLFNGTDPFPQVSWVKSRVGYQIFPERFCNGDPSNDALALKTDYFNYCEVCGNRKPILSNWSDPPTPLHCCHQYYGGDLRGIIEKLDYLKELGIGLIYLTPIFISGSAHGYDTYDYFKVDPKFGTEEDLRELLEEAHKRGIKVIFDFVPDHVGVGFWAFQDVYKRGPESPYWGWFIVYKWPFKLGDGSAYRGWWGLGSLPQLNVLNNEVKNYLINVALYWLDFGFDGLRIDTPLDVIDNVNFFRQLRAAVKAKHPDAYIVGEIWDNRPDWLRGDRFDSLMNYYLGRNILLPYARGQRSGEATAKSMAEYYASIGVNVAGMNFNIITSHDTSRLLTELGGGPLGSTPSDLVIKRLKLITTIQFTVPGMPVIYMGDERGYTGDKNRYDEQRYPIQWDKVNEDILEHYKALAKLKNEVEALHTSIIRILPSKGSVLAFTRGYNDEVLVVANNDDVNATAYELPEGEWRIAYSTDNAVIEGKSLVLPPLSAAVLIRADAAPPAEERGQLHYIALIGLLLVAILAAILYIYSHRGVFKALKS